MNKLKKLNREKYQWLDAEELETAVWMQENNPSYYEAWLEEILAQKKLEAKEEKELYKPVKRSNDYPDDIPKPFEYLMNLKEYRASVKKWLGGDICKNKS